MESHHGEQRGPNCTSNSSTTISTTIPPRSIVVAPPRADPAAAWRALGFNFGGGGKAINRAAAPTTVASSSTSSSQALLQEQACRTLREAQVGEKNDDGSSSSESKKPPSSTFTGGVSYTWMEGEPRERLEKAVQEIERAKLAGHEPKLSKVAKKFNIPRRTLRNHVKKGGVIFKGIVVVASSTSSVALV